MGKQMDELVRARGNRKQCGIYNYVVLNKMDCSEKLAGEHTANVFLEHKYSELNAYFLWYMGLVIERGERIFRRSLGLLQDEKIALHYLYFWIDGNVVLDFIVCWTYSAV